MQQHVIPDFSARDLRHRVEAVGVGEDSDYGDHRWNPGHPHLDQMRKLKLRDAAVLIAIVDRPEGATVILTKRTEALRNHSGQVAFPGGRIDATDATPEFAALREADEEIGLRPDQVEVIGRMPDYKAGSGFRIAPIIGIVQPGFELDVNPDEVDAVFEVPLRFLMNPQNHTRNSRIWNDIEWSFFDMPYGGQRIWGVTAGMIRSFYERYYA